MSEVSTKLIGKAIYKLCFEANTCLNETVYTKIYNAYLNADTIESKNIFGSILQNAQIAYETKKPLCQDTGQVIVFVDIGQDVKLIGNFIEDEINNAVKLCYQENFFRKSVVNNAVFDRTNTKNNTPCIIYTKFIKNDEIKIKVLIKGAGSENKTKLKMLLPSLEQDEIVKELSDLIISSGVNACPPMFIGIGIGAVADRACVMSKEAFLVNIPNKENEQLAEKIKLSVNQKADFGFGGNYVLDVKVLTAPTHIASMPAAVTINCHSDRYSSCIIKNNEITYEHKVPKFKNIPDNEHSLREIHSSDIETLKSLKESEEILLTGEVYVARDAAHKRISDMLKNNIELPFELKDKIIFYAGPCPNRRGEVIGSIGPTTASRMDRYAIELYKKGLFATIGKGTRSDEVSSIIKKYNGKYFTVTGGIAALLSQKVKKSQIIAFEELGPEAVYKITVEKFPLKTAI